MDGEYVVRFTAPNEVTYMLVDEDNLVWHVGFDEATRFSGLAQAYRAVRTMHLPAGDCDDVRDIVAVSNIREGE